MKSEQKYVSYSSWKSQSILRHLDIDELAYMEESTEIRHYKRGEVIFLEGKRIGGCFVVLSGIVKQFKTGGEGRDYIIRLAKPFEMLGYRSVMSEEPACHTSSVLEDSNVCYIPKECLHHLVRNNGNFALDLLQIACRELEETHSMITDIAQKSVKERLAELLLVLKTKFGVNENGQINIMLSREELANVVGTATESVIRILSEFKADKLIEMNGKKISIVHEKALEKIAIL